MACNVTDFELFGSGSHPFDIAALANLSQVIAAHCPLDSPYLAAPAIISAANASGLLVGPVLTVEAVLKFTGQTGNNSWSLSDWSAYLPSMILQRFVSFKEPLLQLILLMPRPPYGFWTLLEGLFVITCVMGDPIQTIGGLLCTLWLATYRVRKLIESGQTRATALLMVLLITAVEETGNASYAAQLEQHFLQRVTGDGSWTQYHELSAHFLASDRLTSFLPVISAIVLFLGSWTVGYGKLAISSFNLADPWHIELWSMSFSMTVLWVIPAVIFASIIGVPQSGLSTKRILRQLDANLAPEQETEKLNEELVHLEEPVREVRLQHGGIPAWRYDGGRPNRNRLQLQLYPSREEAASRYWQCTLIAILLVTFGFIGAVVLSARVSPDGVNTRVICIFVVWLTYVVSYLTGLAIPFLATRATTQSYMVLAKNILFTLILTTIIITTQVGILDRCESYATWGHGLNSDDPVWLPFNTYLIVQKRMEWPGEYGAIMAVTAALELIIAFCVAMWLWPGVCVFVQKDDGSVPLSRSQDRRPSDVVARSNTRDGLWRLQSNAPLTRNSALPSGV